MLFFDKSYTFFLKRVPVAILLILIILLACGCSSDEKPVETVQTKVSGGDQVITFGGGPMGGTFNRFAKQMSVVISDTHREMEVEIIGSAGSLENLKALDNSVMDMAIIYSGDGFLGSKAKLPGDSKRYDKVRALAFLYGAPAQLVVRKGVGIDTVQDLAGKRVAVGNPGSGAALSASRFLKHLGLWEQIEVVEKGYAKAVPHFLNGEIDAFWVLTGWPNSSVKTAMAAPAKLLSLHEAALVSGFYDVYPFYSVVKIPANTYAGQGRPVSTFQDAALWCVSESMPPERVYELLGEIYGEISLMAMVSAIDLARDMSVENGLRGVSIPLHPGAVRFWTERGSVIPPSIR